MALVHKQGKEPGAATAEARQSYCVLGTPGWGQSQEFTAIPKAIRVTCGLTSLKGHVLLCVSLAQHKEGHSTLQKKKKHCRSVWGIK